MSLSNYSFLIAKVQVTAEPESTTQVKFNWTPADPFADLYDVILRIQETDETCGGNGVTSCVVGSLLPGKRYNAVLEACSDLLCIPATQPVEEVTFPGRKQPQVLTCS